MKILDSNITFMSDNHFEQLDLSLNEKTSEKKIRQVQIRQPANNTGDLLQILADRVSISQKQTLEYQSNYSAGVIGKSFVQSKESGEVVEHEHQFAMEELIGGVIDKKVVINSIQREEDVQLADGKKTDSNIPVSAQNLVKTSAVETWEMKLKQTDIYFKEENVRFNSVGEVTTEDGRVIDFSLDMSLDKTFLSRIEHETIVQRWQERVDLIDPLVISLDGKAPGLSDFSFEFDLDSDGKAENISFVSSGSGFLAFDKNNDNVINNGSELFGPGTGNGFEELAAFDEDQNNWIDENDAVFSKLSVWTKNEKGEDMLISLKDAGIGAISLDYAATSFSMTEADNTLQGQLKSTGIFLFENGNVGSMHQIDLAVINEPEGETQPSQLNVSDNFVAPVVTNEFQPEDLTNPLKELLDRIAKLKEEMGRLLEGMNPASANNRFKRSGKRYYSEFKLDTSVFMFGYNGPVRTRSRYV